MAETLLGCSMFLSRASTWRWGSFPLFSATKRPPGRGLAEMDGEDGADGFPLRIGIVDDDALGETLHDGQPAAVFVERVGHLGNDRRIERQPGVENIQD